MTFKFKLEQVPVSNMEGVKLGSNANEMLELHYNRLTIP